MWAAKVGSSGYLGLINLSSAFVPVLAVLKPEVMREGQKAVKEKRLTVDKIVMNNQRLNHLSIPQNLPTFQ